MSLDCVLHVYIDDCNDPPSIAMQTIDAKEDSVYGDIVGTVLAHDDDPGDSLYFSIIDQKESMLSSNCNIISKLSCVWVDSLLDVAGNAKRFDVDRVQSGRITTTNIKFVAMGPTAGFQLREWGNVTYRMHIFVSDQPTDDVDRVDMENVLTALTGDSAFVYISVAQVNSPPSFQNCNAERRASETALDPIHQDAERVEPDLIALEESTNQNMLPHMDYLTD